MNITDSDEGFYYCGTEQTEVEDKSKISQRNIYTYGNATRIIVRVVSCSHDGISGSVLKVTVRPGQNVTLYCDCKPSTGIFIVWYRNCSHENLVPRTKYDKGDAINKDHTAIMNPFPHFHLVKNQSTESYDLLIKNITDSDEGLYYCGTE
ncbi:hypothetical protein KUCAC02_016153 [Scomber scombrus]|uniref:Ig-like domain-containing protein n=1 Tax=Scomber scombrus TaxID=13677 RepID=A0AAV1N2G0_SCOSC